MSDNLYQAPSSQVTHFDSENRNPPTFLQKLFSFQGRFSRGAYWGWAVGMRALIIIVAAIPAFMIPPAKTGNFDSPSTGSDPITIVALIIFFLGLAVGMWVGLAGIAKRFHDRNKSGWMAAILFIPYIGSLWIFIECGCLAGTQGRNVYGSDPLRMD